MLSAPKKPRLKLNPRPIERMVSPASKIPRLAARTWLRERRSRIALSLNDIEACDQQEIKDVTAEDVADCQIGRTDNRGRGDANAQLRKRGDGREQDDTHKGFAETRSLCDLVAIVG